MDAIGDTSKRTAGRLVTWLEARRFIDRHLATMREEINVSNMDVFSKAIALRELFRVWRAANITLVKLRLPKRRKKGRDVLDLAYTLNPEGKVTARRSRKRHPVKARRFGRSHHKGVYVAVNVKDGVPQVGRRPKYHTDEERKAGARRRARLSYLRRTKGRKRYATTDKETREKRRAFMARLKDARLQVRFEMKGEKIARSIGDFFLARDKRANHRPDYAYDPPHPRLRRTRAQVARWGRKSAPNKKEAIERAARRAESRKKRRLRSILAFALQIVRRGKRIDALHDGRNHYWKEFGHRVHEKLGWTGRRLGAKGTKRGAQ